ncbi:hypothetical protein [Stutzerimonas stutzeri]|uniref:hypothetical protein n=1 Tax=Stutzerimonas stutzeri TaxID=316 RepID=UPI002020F456|nr:hypothetical protein [Stutzerimonas stutzeri]
MLGVIREEIGPLLDGTDLSLLGGVGGSGIGRVSVTPEVVQPGVEMAPLRSPKASARFRGLDTAIQEAGLSGPRKPERSGEVIGRSELLGKR